MLFRAVLTKVNSVGEVGGSWFIADELSEMHVGFPFFANAAEHSAFERSRGLESRVQVKSGNFKFQDLRFQKGRTQERL